MYTRWIALLLMLGLVSSVNAAPPIGFIKGEVEKVRSLLKIPVKDNTPEKDKIDDQLRSILNPVMNFDRLSENALRNHSTTCRNPSPSSAQSCLDRGGAA